MKNLLTVFLTLCTGIVFSQASGNIITDTTLANTYLNQAIVMEQDSPAIILLEQAWKLYEPYTIYEKQVEINGRLAYRYLSSSDSLCELHAFEAIRLAKEHLDTLHPSLVHAYYALQTFNHLHVPQQAIFYGKKALQIAPKHSRYYVDAMLALMKDYTYSNQTAELSALLDDLEAALFQNEVPPTLETVLYRGKMQLNLNLRTYEKAIIYGKQCVLSNQKTNLISNEELGPFMLKLANLMDD